MSNMLSIGTYVEHVPTRKNIPKKKRRQACKPKGCEVPNSSKDEEEGPMENPSKMDAQAQQGSKVNGGVGN